MTFEDVSPSEMRALRGSTPQDIERLLSGRVPAAGPELDDLTSFLSSLGEAFPEPRVEAVEAKHLTAMMEAAKETAASEPATLPTTETPRSRTSRYISSMKRKVAAASVAGLTAFSGMAVAGVLPPSVQRGVADAAGHVGIDLPSATADEAPIAREGQRPERPSEEIAEPGENHRSDRRDADRPEGSEGEPDRERAAGSAATSKREESADEARDREEDAADDAQGSEDESADEARDREEDAADDAQGSEEESADDDADRAEDAADDAPQAEEELDSGD